MLFRCDFVSYVFKYISIELSRTLPDTISVSRQLSDVGEHPAIISPELIVRVSPSPGLAPDSVLQTGDYQYNSM